MHQHNSSMLDPRAFRLRALKGRALDPVRGREELVVGGGGGGVRALDLGWRMSQLSSRKEVPFSNKREFGL